MDLVYKNNMIKIQNNKYSIINLALIIFFIHGILYFIYPEQIYDETSSIKLIKYFLICFLIIIYLYEIQLLKIIIFTILFILLVLIHYVSLNFRYSITGFLYIVPFIVMLLINGVIFKKSNFFFVAIVSYIFVSIFGYIEYFQETFSRNDTYLTGYRISSILVNPNNLGVFLVFSTILILENLKKSIYSPILILNTLLLLYFSFSKASIILFLIYLGVKYTKISLLFIFILYIFTINYIENNYEILIFSLNARFEYNDLFLNILNQNIIAPFFNSYQYTDNVYLNLYGNFSIFIFIIFIIFNQILLMLLLLRNFFKHILYLSLFLISGLSENFLYLSPLAYMYWGYVFWLLKYKLNVTFGIRFRNE